MSTRKRSKKEIQPERELWELFGPDWKLPIGVYWYDELAEIRIGCGANLLQIQWNEAAALLTSIGDRRGNTFWVSRGKLQVNAIPSRERDPEGVVEWAGRRQPQPSQATEDFEASEFVRGYCSSEYGLIRDELVFETVWCSICKFMLHRLMNEGVAVDLLWCRLIPLMMRPNWKNVLVKRETTMKSRQTKGRDLIETREDLFRVRFNPNPEAIAYRMGAAMLTSSMTGWDDESKTMQWTVELILQKPFMEFSRTLEKFRKRSRKIAYFYRVIDQLRRQLPHAIECYSHYLEEARRPYYQLPGSDMLNNPVEVLEGTQLAPSVVVPHQNTGGDRVPAVLDGWNRFGLQEGDNEFDLATEEVLPPVPDLQPGGQDLRDAGESLAESGNGRH